MRVPRVVGIESEADVAYAALQLMFVRDLDRLDALLFAVRDGEPAFPACHPVGAEECGAVAASTATLINPSLSR
ncbi:MAG: hypothetical protein ACRDNL_00975 [Spirillospora sp.]